MLSISFLCNISFKAPMSILRHLSETYFWDRNASWSDLLSVYISIGMLFKWGWSSFSKTVMADSAPSIIAIVSAAKVLCTMCLICLDYQLIRSDLLCLSTSNITCPPWLPPSLRFPKAASINKTTLNGRSNGWYLNVYWLSFIFLISLEFYFIDQLQTHHHNDKVIGVMTVHKDDFLWAGTDLFYLNIISKLRETFSIGREV